MSIKQRDNNNNNNNNNHQSRNNGNNSATAKPHYKAALPNTANNNNVNNSKRAASPGPKGYASRPIDEVRIDFDNTSLNRIELIPSLVNGESQSKTTNKTWDKNSSKGDKDFGKNKITAAKAFKVDIDQVGGNHAVIVNHVTVNYNSQNQSRLQSGGGSKNTNNNNNQANESHPLPGSSKSSHKQQPLSKSSTTSNQQTAASTSKSSRDPADKIRQEIREFNDMLQSNLKIPKSVLKVLHDSCTSISSCVSPIKAAGSFNRNSATSAASAKGSTPTAKTNPTSSSVHRESLYTWKSSVWSCGQNSYGELGLGDVNLRKNFTKVTSLDDKSVMSIGAGNEHSLFVTKDGKLFTSGYNDNGQCGVGSTQQVRQPTLVQALEGEEIAQVNVYNGCEHTLAITKDGKIFSFGYNYRGQV